jgi:hypothetical protein
MLDVHAPTPSSTRGYIHQRHQLQHDLLEEAKRNRDILMLDLGLESQAAWFREVLAATQPIPASGQTTIKLPSMPCIPHFPPTRRGGTYVRPPGS